jgi:hypothetical protein
VTTHPRRVKRGAKNLFIVHHAGDKRRPGRPMTAAANQDEEALKVDSDR